MYAKYFGFKALPFQLSPDPRFLFESSEHSRAIAHLKFGLNQGEGFIVVTGEVGAGKTTIIQHLLGTLSQRKYVAATVVTTNLDDENILRMIASGYDIRQEGRDKASLLLAIEDFLRQAMRRGKHCLLFVDEAQNLTIPALEELRMLSNIQIDGQVPLQLFLLGQPQFRATLASDDLLQLRQRVIASYHLGPMSEEDTAKYIIHRLNQVGWRQIPDFSEDAFGPIYQHTDGVPRRINNLCSRLLLYCYLEEEDLIDAQIVDAVAEDLEREFDQVLDRPPTKTEQSAVMESVATVPPSAQPAISQPVAAAPQAVAAPEAPVAPPVASAPPPPQPVTPEAAMAQPVTRAAPPPPQPAAAAAPRKSEPWGEVVDLIESTPVDALASLSPNGSPEPANKGLSQEEAQARERTQSQLFKRLLLLILDEYLKGRPEPRGQ